MDTGKGSTQLETNSPPNYLFMEILRAPWFMELDHVMNRRGVTLLPTEGKPLSTRQ
jgi:hypothetical protein